MTSHLQLVAGLARWPARRWLVAAAAAAVFAVAAGAPTDVIPTPLFGRMTPVQWWSYPILAATALLGSRCWAGRYGPGLLPNAPAPCPPAGERMSGTPRPAAGCAPPVP